MIPFQVLGFDVILGDKYPKIYAPTMEDAVNVASYLVKEGFVHPKTLFAWGPFRIKT